MIEPIQIITADGPIPALSAGDGPLMLFVHGFPDTPHSFHHQLEFFSAKGYRVVAPWLRGYTPDGPDRSGDYSMAALGQDLLDCITALGYGQAILVGHDWGAAAADAAALAAPDSTSHLITCAVPYSPSVMHALATNSDQQRRSWYMFFFQTPLADQAIATNDFELIKRLWQEWAAPHWQGDPATLDAVLTCFRQPGITGAALAYYRQLLTTPPPTEYLPITCPALYIHGDQDGCIGIELATPQQQFYSRGCDFMAVAGAGHFVHLEKPAQFNQRVAEFIAT